MSRFPTVSFLKSAHRPGDFCPDLGLEVAFAGRSNSGKSSAINAILARRDLARTSRTPGRTQLVNFFELGDGRRVVDLPGYGYARVAPALRQHWKGLMEAYFSQRDSLAGLFLVMDCRRPLTDSDWQMLEFAAARACPIHVLLSKSDKPGRNEARQALRRASEQLSGRASAQLFSSVTGEGLESARKVLNGWLTPQ